MRVSYDGTKTLRIETSSSIETAENLKKILSDLSLSLWTQVVASNTHADFEVPKEEYVAFEKAITGKFVYSTMHEDLRASIRDESGGFTAYDSVCFPPPSFPLLFNPLSHKLGR